jgi:hypothetical protein
MNEIKKEVELEKLIYFSDLYRLLLDTVKEKIDDSIGEQFCCQCAGTENDEKCECVKRKERRDGTKEWQMSAGQISLERAHKIVKEIADKVISILEKKSFVCECPPKKIMGGNK